MSDEEKTREQLVEELASLRESLRECDAALQSRSEDLDDLARYVVSEFRGPLGTVIGYTELMKEDFRVLSHEDLYHCIHTIKRNGRKLGEMVNELLLLASSHRLFDNVWHAAYLTAMDETSLSHWACESKTSEAYRFTCLPASSAPLVIRVWQPTRETSGFQGIAKSGGTRRDDEGESSSQPLEAEWMLEPEEWDGLLAVVEKSGFWAEAALITQVGWLRMVGAGGEEWIFEGWRHGRYKVRAIWNPSAEKGRAAYALGRSFIHLLPGRFALETAGSWAATPRPKVGRRLGEGMDLDAVLDPPYSTWDTTETRPAGLSTSPTSDTS